MLKINAWMVFLRASWKAINIVTIFVILVAYSASVDGLTTIFDILGPASGAIGVFISFWGFFNEPNFKKRLIKQIRNQVPEQAKSAISELNQEGYLHKNWFRRGALYKQNFTDLNLSGVDLRATDSNNSYVPTDLENIDFTGVNLSNADLTKANLRNAIFNYTDLENAKLIGTQLQNAKFIGTNLRGVDLTNANLDGAIVKNPICDEKTILPNGDKWTANLNWAMFGVSNKTPDYISKQATQEFNIDPLSEKKRQADLQLLQNLWVFIKSQDIRNIVDAVNGRNLKNECVMDTVEKYISLRENSENKFINEELEARFQTFDKSLKEFLNQLSTEETVNDRGIYVPGYKENPARYDDLFRDHNKTIKMGKIAIEHHDEIVVFLKKSYPEFNFMR